VTAITLAEVQAGLQALAGFDFATALANLESLNVQGELAAGEQILDAIAPFIPEAGAISEGLALLGFIDQAYSAGLIVSAPVESPEMSRAARDNSGGR
jgi:hypothetical protein